MPDLISQVTFSQDPSLREGEVGLAFAQDGSIRILHNIEAVRESSTIPPEHRGTFLMALGALEVSSDEDAMTAAMKRAIALFDQLAGPSPADTRN